MDQKRRKAADGVAKPVNNFIQGMENFIAKSQLPKNHTEKRSNFGRRRSHMTCTSPRVITIPAKPELARNGAIRRQLRVAAYCRVSTDDEEQLIPILNKK